jgi:class 3 adenylate cyclase
VPRISSRSLRRIRLGVLAIDTLLLALAVGSQIQDGFAPASIAFLALIVAMVIGLAVIGGLIVDRQRGNAVGWIFMASSLGMATTTSAYSWVSLSHDRFHDGLPLTVFAAWLNSWIGIPSLVALVIFVPLLFPNGQLPSRRWRWAAYFGIVGIVLTSIGSALVAGPMSGSSIENPIGIEIGQLLKDWLGVLDSVSGVVIFTLAIAAVVTRYRHGSPTERLQLRWFGFPAAIATVCLGTSVLVNTGMVGDVAWIVAMVALTAMPVAIGVAILRYRLYDIDLLLNRTAVYASVSAVLAVLFVVGNVGLQYLVQPLIGQRSELLSGVVGVVVGILFGPVRRRIRPLIDRFLPSRAVLALLFTDIVGSTQVLAEIGDQRWRVLLSQYLAVVRAELAQHGGHEVNTAGDAFFATFPRPVDALRAAWAIRSAVKQLGLDTRTGLHLGEVEMRGEQVSGLAVHTAARVMAAGGDGEILVSDAMRDAIRDSGIQTQDRGRHELKGVPGAWQLYAVEMAA